MERKKFKTEITTEVPLKLFLFSLTPVSPFLEDTIEVCLGYELEKVLEELHSMLKDRPEKFLIKPMGWIKMSRISEVIEKKEKEEQLIDIKFVEPEADEEQSKLGYICSLKYAADNFTDILSDTDKKALKRITNKIDKHLAYDTK